MAFMEPEIEKGDWYVVDGPCGIEAIPADLVGDIDLDTPCGEDTVPLPLRDYCENRKAWSIERRHGFGARLSAPGYLDCTAWCVFDTERKAREYLRDEFEDND